MLTLNRRQISMARDDRTSCAADVRASPLDHESALKSEQEDGDIGIADCARPLSAAQVLSAAAALAGLAPAPADLMVEDLPRLFADRRE